MNTIQQKQSCPTHPNKELEFLRVCTSQNELKKNLLYCSKCIGEEYSFNITDFIAIEQIIDEGLKNIIVKWPPVKDYQTLQNLKELQTQDNNTQEIEQQIIHYFNELKDEIFRDIELCQKRIISCTKNQPTQILQQYQQISKISELRQLVIDNEAYNNQQKNLSDFIQQMESEKEKNTYLLSNILNANKNDSSCFDLEFPIKIKQEVKSLINQIDFFSKNPKLYSLCFSNEFKTPTIQLKSPLIALQTQSQEKYGFCLTQNKLSHNTKQRWGFKIINLTSWIGIGICIQSQIIKNQYMFNYPDLGNGYYMLSSNQYSWSHSQKGQQCVQSPFKFTSDDTIFIQLDPLQKELMFLNSKTNQKYCLDLDFNETDDLVPCVSLYNQGEEVEIINNKDVLEKISF